MKYLCLLYYDVQKFAQLSPEQMEAIAPACAPHDEALRRTGKRVTQGSFSFPEEWRTIRPVNGKPVVTDGPISSDPQQAGAFMVIEAEDMNEATATASKHAAANFGEHLGFAVDVRLCEMFE